MFIQTIFKKTTYIFVMLVELFSSLRTFWRWQDISKQGTILAYPFHYDFLFLEMYWAGLNSDIVKSQLRCDDC